MTKFTSIVTEKTVVPENESVFDERATRIKIVDEAAGAFVELSQEAGKLQIDTEEWELIKQEVDDMFRIAEDINRRLYPDQYPELNQGEQT